MTMKTTFVEEKDMIELAYLSKEREVVHEGGIPLPPQHSSRGLKKGNGEKSSNNQPTPTLRRSGEKIN